MSKDYIAQWYEVREEYGVPDQIHCFLHNQQTQTTDWHHFRHRDMDGISMIATMKKTLGYKSETLPQCREAQEPGFWQTWQRVRRSPKNKAAKIVRWRNADDSSVNTEFFSCANEPDFFVLDSTVLHRLKQQAEECKVSCASLTLAALNKAVFEHCLEPDSQAWWFYPVNVRGADPATHTGNRSSGFYLALNANSSAADIHALVKQKLAAQEHWWLWKMAHIGRFIGKSGVRFIYQRLSQRQFYLGSFSYLGNWSLPDHPALLLGVCGAGSANYPIATGITECNGQLTLALKFHPSLPAAATRQTLCLHSWAAYLQDVAHV